MTDELRLRAARDQHLAVPLAAAAPARRGDQEPRAALPDADRADLRRRRRSRRPRERPHPRRVGDELGGDPGVPARPARHRQAVACVPARRRSRVAMPWIVYSTVLAHRGRRLPAVSLGDARRCSRSITSPRWSHRPGRPGRDRARLLRANAVRPARRRPFQSRVVAYELASAGEGSLPGKPAPEQRSRGPCATTSTLVCFYVPLLLAALRLPRTVGRPQPPQPLQQRGLGPRSRLPLLPARRPDSAADLAFGMGILPFVVGTAWLLAGVVRPSGGEPDARVRLRRISCRC